MSTILRCSPLLGVSNETCASVILSKAKKPSATPEFFVASLRRMTAGIGPGGFSRIHTARSGFTLMEVVVAMGILGVVIGMFGPSVFQTLSVQRYWREDVTATRQLRNAGYWFSGDAFNAKTTSLTADVTPASSVTLTWTDPSNQTVTHTAIYGLNPAGDELIRNFDGEEIPVARGVVSVGFSLSGKVLTLDLGVQAARG